MGVMNEDRLTLYDGLIKTHITNTTVAKETGKGLSTNDYTTTEKNKLAGIATGANKTIVDSALDASSENPVQNKVITGEINTLKKSVSDGKTLVATAITDKGVDTAADATFAVMAENIGQIETGGGELHGATISVTTSEENPTTITVTLTKDSTTIEQKNFDSNGMCTFTDIQESGDYTITASDGTDSNSTTATVTGDNIVNKTVISVTINFTLDGSTATPLNDVSIWLRTDSTGSSLHAGHTTLAEVIADTTTLSSLMADESAMNYLARSTGFAEEGCASETFMTYLGASTYVDSTVLNSDSWVTNICSSDYFKSVLIDKIPTMTSNTTPSGKASASSVLPGTTWDAWQAFGSDNIPWHSANGSIQWIMYKFEKPICVKKVYICNDLTVAGGSKVTYIQASNDGSTWTNLSSAFDCGNIGASTNLTLNNKEYYQYYRLYSTESNYFDGYGHYLVVNILQFYGRYQKE